MSDLEKQTKELTQAIAGRIRSLRKAQSWTLERLANVTGFSKGYLSQVENGEKNPPINTLNKIAYGLGVNVVTLLTGEDTHKPSPFVLVKKGQGKDVIPPNAQPGYSYHSLAYKKTDRVMDAYIVEVAPIEFGDYYLHEGQEFVMVLEGRQKITYDDRSYVMEPGDVAYFDSNRPHKAHSLNGKPAKVLVVFCNPLRSA